MNMRTRTVYCIENLANGKRYIGQSVRPAIRFKEHLWRLRCGKHYNKHLQAAFDKYGEPSFLFSIIEEFLTDDSADACERYWIQQYNSCNAGFGYNQETGGHVGKNHSDEAKRRISEAHKGIRPSEQTRAKLRLAHRTREPASDETRRKLSEAVKGRKRSPEFSKMLAERNRSRPMSLETRRKIGDASRGRIVTPETTRKRIATLQRNKRLRKGMDFITLMGGTATIKERAEHDGL